MWQRITNYKIKTHNVVPIGEKHTDFACWCKPRIEHENGWKIFIHHSADKREYLEPDTTEVGIIN